MRDFLEHGLRVPSILLPGEGVDLQKWSVVACDQYTAQPEYWRDAESFVGDAPSTLHMIYPEAFLSEGDARIQSINRAMADYKQTVLTRAANCFVLVERKISTGHRLGLMAEVDLDRYDYSPGSTSLIRATEGTILSRIPPRVVIRENASLESPHILMLLDDPGKTFIEPLHELREGYQPLYAFDLMCGGGHIRGWKVPETAHPSMLAALGALHGGGDGLLFAVGDGNHSLATAKACWEAIRDSIPEAERANHPARYALVEIGNLHDPSLVFEPIHRVLFHIDPVDFASFAAEWFKARGMALGTATNFKETMFLWVDPRSAHPQTIQNVGSALPLSLIQQCVDEYLSTHPGAEIDYVHGDAVAAGFASHDACAILLRPIDKSMLFSFIRLNGALPRKTFSMGEAHEKRYYLECRAIQ